MSGIGFFFLFFIKKKLLNALGSPAQIEMWWSWQIVNKFPTLSTRSCCLNWLWTFISSHQSFWLCFSSASWNRALVSLEARNQFTSLLLFMCSVPVLYYNPFKFIDCGEPQISQNSCTEFPTEYPRRSSWKFLGSRSLRPRNYWVCFVLESLTTCGSGGRHGDECWEAANTEDLKFYFITLVKDTKIFFKLCFVLSIYILHIISHAENKGKRNKPTHTVMVGL